MTIGRFYRLGVRTLRNALTLIVVSCFCAPSWCQLIIHRVESFTSLYDVSLGMPRQVEWVLHSTDMGNAQRSASWIFFNDINVPGSNASHTDFTRSGFDRGHMCPAADRSATRSAMHSTFSLANIAAQAPTLNRGAWKVTEDSCRNLAQQFDSVRIVAVPIILQDDTMRIGKHHLAVPHAFFKVAWLPANDSIVGVWFFWNR